MQIILNEKETKEYFDLKRRLKDIYTRYNNLCSTIQEIPLFNKYIDDLKNIALPFYYDDLEELK